MRFLCGGGVRKVVPQFLQTTAGNVVSLLRKKQPNQIEFAVRGSFRMGDKGGANRQFRLGRDVLRGGLFSSCWHGGWKVVYKGRKPERTLPSVFVVMRMNGAGIRRGNGHDRKRPSRSRAKAALEVYRIKVWYSTHRCIVIVTVHSR
jgi:hypothetical protein